MTRRTSLAMLMTAIFAAIPAVANAQRDIPYGPLPGQLLDLYPTEEKGRLVVFIHGGGWHSGDKRGISSVLIQTLRRRGIAVASVNFRQAPEVQIEGMLADVRLAIKHLRQEWPSISLMGASSGGHLAALLGMSESGIRAVVDKCGPADLTLPRANPIQVVTILRAFGSTPGPSLKAFSPVHQVHKHCPPFLLIHGKNDTLVPVAQSHALDSALKAHGVASELIVVDHAGHDFTPVGSRPSLSEAQLAVRIADFLAAH